MRDDAIAAAVVEHRDAERARGAVHIHVLTVTLVASDVRARRLAQSTAVAQCDCD
jgi:hypothetical protein